MQVHRYCRSLAAKPVQVMDHSHHSKDSTAHPCLPTRFSVVHASVPWGLFCAIPNVLCMIALDHACESEVPQAQSHSALAVLSSVIAWDAFGFRV